MKGRNELARDLKALTETTPVGVVVINWGQRDLSSMLHTPASGACPSLAPPLGPHRRPSGVGAVGKVRADGQTPTTDEVEAAEQYLLGRGDRPALDALVDETATERLDGAAQIRPDASSREFDIYRRLMAHTRERPEEENQWQFDRDNRGSVRSNDAARMLVQTLDGYQGEQYGQTDNGTLRAPPSAEHFSAWAAGGRRRNATSASRRRSSTGAPPSHRSCCGRFARQSSLAKYNSGDDSCSVQRRRAEKRAAEAWRRQLSAVRTPAPSRSREHETPDGFVASMHDTVSGTETDDGFPPA